MRERITNGGISQGSISPHRPLGTIWTLMAGMVAMLMLIGTPAVSAEQTPTESVTRTIDDVIQILNDDALKQRNRAGERRQKIERVVRQRVSYEDMAQRALGRPWIKLTNNEQEEFVGLFVQLLRDMFAGRIDDYTDEQVLYLSEQQEENYAEVRTRLVGQKVDTVLDFRLSDKSGQWSVYDVVIDGASIVGNYHAQFTRIIRDHAYAGLVKRMKEQTLVVKAFETTTAP
jgi:phospholipid transport system substrate-binding protein